MWRRWSIGCILLLRVHYPGKGPRRMSKDYQRWHSKDRFGVREEKVQEVTRFTIHLQSSRILMTGVTFHFSQCFLIPFIIIILSLIAYFLQLINLSQKIFPVFVLFRLFKCLKVNFITHQPPNTTKALYKLGAFLRPIRNKL